MREIRVDARRGPTVSPWNLRPSEARVLDALVETGRSNLAARKLGIAKRTIESALANARDALGVENSIHAAIKWHDWRKGQQQ